MDNKLKPCPFCGGEGVLHNEGLIVCSFVKCEDCGASTEMVRVSTEYCSNEKAIDAWNRRFEKESPLPVEYEGDGYDDNGKLIYDTAYCPNCRNEYEVDYDYHDNYCRKCGRKLDWRSDNGQKKNY